MIARRSFAPVKLRSKVSLELLPRFIDVGVIGVIRTGPGPYKPIETLKDIHLISRILCKFFNY